MKDLNFLIFRDFSRIFLFFMSLIQFFLIKKIIILSHADVAVNVAGVKMHRHVVVYVHTTWCTRMRVCAYARVCTHVRLCD